MLTGLSARTAASKPFESMPSDHAQRGPAPDERTLVTRAFCDQCWQPERLAFRLPALACQFFWRDW